MLFKASPLSLLSAGECGTGRASSWSRLCPPASKGCRHHYVFSSFLATSIHLCHDGEGGKGDAFSQRETAFCPSDVSGHSVRAAARLLCYCACWSLSGQQTGPVGRPCPSRGPVSPSSVRPPSDVRGSFRHVCVLSRGSFVES